MSDKQRDREERQHVIEVLQNMVDWMQEIDDIAAPERIHALFYAIASIKTDLKYDLLYEETIGQADKPTTKNDVSDINVGKIKSTTKNDLVVDWENYKDVDGNSLDDLILEVLQNNFDCGNTYGYKVADEIIELLPSVTPQEPKTGHWIRVTDKAGHLVWECDKCGWQQRFNTNYCPDCGADMQEVEE